MSRRIALVSSSYHPHPGGVEEHVRNLAGEVARAGDEVVVWTVDRGEHLGTRRVDGIEVRYLPAPLPARDAAALGRFAVRAPAAWRAWARAHRAFRPDVLHVHCFGPNGIFALGLHLRFGTPLLVTSHGETFMDDHAIFDESALLRSALRRSLAAASVVTGVSSVVCDDLRSRFGASGCEVVPNGIDLEEGAIAQPAADGLPASWPHGARVVLGIGRVEHMKGFDLLLRSFAAVSRPDEHLVVVGDGSQRGALEELARGLGIATRVHLPGRLDRPAVVAAMAGADVVVVPSRLEAFGIVALEAWRAGTPLVMTSRGGALDFVVDGQNGLLVDPEDEAALGDAIRSVLDDPDTAGALAAAGRVAVRDFTWRRVAGAYRELYDRVRPG